MSYLSENLNYLINVLIALGIHRHSYPLLVYITQMEDKDGLDNISRITSLMKVRILNIKV